MNVINIGPVEIVVHGFQYPDSDEYWDANWLNVTATLSRGTTIIVAAGAIVHTSELQSFMDECKSMHNTISGSANLNCMEPNLKIEMKIDKLGGIDAVIEITPDHLKEEHRIYEVLDQSYLPGIISSLEDCLSTYSRLKSKR